jgi:hypothetical protein
MTATGILSFAHWRFGAVVLLHVLACALFLETGALGPVEIPIGFMALCIAFIIVATVAWQWKSLGDPRELPNFLGHLLLVASVFFLIVRLHSPITPPPTVMSAIAASAKWAASVVGVFPPALFDSLASPATAVFFVLTCFALSLQRHYAVGLFVLLAVAAVTLAARQPNFGSLPAFLGGLACLGVAIGLQFNNAEERQFWRRVYERVDEEKALRGDLELKYRVLKRLLREGRPITEQECLATIERALDRTEKDPVLQETSVRVVRQMVRADGIVHVEDSSRGRVLVLNPDLYQTPTDVFAMIAVVPRTICVCAVAFLWVLSPIDIVPDSLPVAGVLDDAMVTILGGAAVSNMLQWLRLKKRGNTMEKPSYLSAV